MADDSSFHPPNQELEQRAQLFGERATALLEELKGTEGDITFKSMMALLYFLQSQNCYAELNRRETIETDNRDRKRENRHFWIEIGLTVLVVLLIGAELYLSVHYGRLGLKEGQQQAAILEDMKRSTAAAASLQTETLKILQEEQNARVAQLAKKPKLVLYLEDKPLKAGSHFTPRKQTETSATFDLDLTNNGDATATDALFHVSVSAKDVFVDPPFTEVLLPPDQTMRTFEAPSNLPIRPQSHARVTITIHYPKGHAPFDIVFLAETNDQPAAPLGSLRVTPQKSPN